MANQQSFLPEPVSAWWHSQTPRDQIIVQILAAASVVIFGWLLAWKPIAAWHGAAERDLAAAASKHAAVASAAQTRAMLEARVGPDANRAIERVNLRVAISSSTQARGLKLVRLQPSADGRLTVWLDDVAADQLFAWLSDLNSRYGIRVVTASIQPDRDKPTVQGQIQFEGP